MTAAIASLLEPFDVGPVTLRNRVFVAPHTTNFAVPGVNQITERHLAYHDRRAAGGAGLIITEGLRVHPTSLRRLGLEVYSDTAVPGLRELAQTVHRHGTKLFAQLLHTGRHTGDERRGAWAPSPLPWTVGAPMPHVMNSFDIAAVVRSFADSARRVLDAGFDGIEVHIGHGHLLQQFLSPITNLRGDAYGGDADRRMRLTRDVLAAVAEVVAGRAALGVRLSADEFLPGGLSVDDMVSIVAGLLDGTPLDFLHVSHSAYAAQPSLDTQMADMTWPTAAFRHLPARFKREFPRVAVLAVCRLDDLKTGARLVADGEADLVGYARAHIADPDLVAKATGRDRRRVRSCIACNQGCNHNLELVIPITCTVNPEAGMEAAWARAAAATRRRCEVVVIGGGPAGMEAAATAARHGHKVALWEASDRLGGRLRSAAELPGRTRFGLLIDELRGELDDACVEVSSGHPADVARILQVAPDVVVIATGAEQQLPPSIEGADFRIVGVEEALRLPESLGTHVVIVDELGTWVAAGLAEQVATAGSKVELVTSAGGVAWNVTVYSRLSLVERLGRMGVKVRPLRSVDGGRRDHLLLVDVVGGDREVVENVSAVVYVRPSVASDSLLAELSESGFVGVAHLAGDAYAPRTCLEAVYDGRVVGTTIGIEDDEAIADLLPRPPYVFS